MGPTQQKHGGAMSYSLQGMVAAAVFVAGIGAWSAIDRDTNYKPVQATVDMIDRKCDIVETTSGAGGRKTSRIYTDDCKSVDAWEDARAKHDKTISGKAVVTVSYSSPKDASLLTAELRFDSRDNEFYDLKAGDQVKVLVSNTDPTKIRKA